MNSYLVGYDLNKSGQDCEKLIEQIKNLGLWWHCLDSTWIIKSNASAVEIREHLKQNIDNNDELIVIRLMREAAWTGFSKECSDWLNNNL